MKDGKRICYGVETQAKRESLIAGDEGTKREALAELDAKGAAGSRRRWWAFEGFTSVDCRLETDSLVLFIEGKRTESVSASVTWFPARNQVVRNLESAACEAARVGKDYAVLVCAETPLALAEDTFETSLPHLSHAARNDLRKHYLGCVTWEAVRQALCPRLTLPETVDQAVSLCAASRV